LMRCDAEARPVIAAEIERCLAHWFIGSHPYDQVCVLGCEITLLGSMLAEETLALSISEQRDWWVEQFKLIATNLEDGVKNMASQDRDCAVLACAVGRLSMTGLLERHGIAALFSTPQPTCIDFYMSGAAERVLKGEQSDDIGELGTALCSVGTPW